MQDCWRSGGLPNEDRKRGAGESLAAQKGKSSVAGTSMVAFFDALRIWISLVCWTRHRETGAVALCIA